MFVCLSVCLFASEIPIKMFTPKKINVPLSIPPSPTPTTKISCCAFKPTLFSTAPRRTPQEIYFESRGKCCKKLLQFNGYPNKVRIDTRCMCLCARGGGCAWNSQIYIFANSFIRLFIHINYFAISTSQNQNFPLKYHQKWHVE